MWAAKLLRNWSLAGQILSVHSTGVMPQEQSLSKFARSHYNGNEWCLRLCLRDRWLSVSFLSRLRVYVDFYCLLLICAFIAAFPSFLDSSLMPVPSHFYLETSSSTNGLCSPFFVWPSCLQFFVLRDSSFQVQCKRDLFCSTDHAVFSDPRTMW